MSKVKKPYKLSWDNLPAFSFQLPNFYFYLHDNCSYCDRFKTRVPKLSSVYINIRSKNC